MNYQEIKIDNNKISQHKQTNHERNRIGRWQRYKAVSYHQGNQQAAYSDFRQADDLLSHLGADACRHQGDTHHFDTLRPAGVQEAAG